MDPARRSDQGKMERVDHVLSKHLGERGLRGREDDDERMVRASNILVESHGRSRGRLVGLYRLRDEDMELDCGLHREGVVPSQVARYGRRSRVERRGH